MPTVLDVTPSPTPSNDPCAQPRAMLDAYLAAEKAVLEGVSVRWGERSLTRANLPDIVKARQDWEAKLSRCLAGCASRLGGANVSLAVLNSEGANCIEGAERQGWNTNGCCR